jgi:hypothetical protein
MEDTVKQTPIKGYKVFNPDFTCKDQKYEVGQTYEMSLPIQICQRGYHYCLNAAHCFSYYSFNPQNIVCEVEGIGEIQTHGDDSKVCTNKIKIVRQLTWDEVLKVANQGKDNTGHSNSGDSNSGDRNSGDSNSGNWNSGDRNSGDSNSGNWNSGDRNSGDSNSGNWNSGDRNSGDSNSGYRNSGAFCLDPNPKLILFDKLTEIGVKEWELSEAVKIMNNLLDLTMWVYSENMTEEQKKANPSHETTGGFLKVKTLHEAWADMWGNLSEDKRRVFTSLPNFDAEKFKIITGITV